MGSPDFDPYAMLSVASSATPDEIRPACRRLAAVYHPDIQPPEKKAWASERMIQLNAARDLLLNPRRRVKYHREHADPMQWSAEKYRWQTPKAQAACRHAPPPTADQSPRPARDQGDTLILFSLAGSVIVGLIVWLGLWKNPVTVSQLQREVWFVAIQQAMIWMAAFGGFLLAALQVLFLTGLPALIVLGLSQWWKR